MWLHVLVGFHPATQSVQSNLAIMVVHVSFVIEIEEFNLNPITPEQRSHGDPMASKKNAECRGACSKIAIITTATHWYRH